jgi:hypothetical protein
MFEDITIVNSKKTPFNIVADKGVTVGTLLQYIVDALPVKWAIIDKPDNVYTLEETILPPGNLVPTLKTLQYHIGIYENGVMAFHEDDVLYILNKFALDHDCKAGDKIITHIYATELDKMLGGITTRGLDPVSGEAVYTGPITVKPSNREILSAELEGNNFIFSSFRQGLSAVKYTNNNPVSDQSKEVSMVMKRNIETYKHTQEKNVITYDELSNIYNMASMFNEIEATVKQMFIKIENINITDFRPNKFVHLHFLDNQKNLKLGGVYHIISMTTIFIPVNPSTTKEMACVGNVLLSKRSSS